MDKKGKAGIIVAVIGGGIVLSGAFLVQSVMKYPFLIIGMALVVAGALMEKEGL